jgi:hypothetical protein
MNLRILKKLSKRAAPLLAKLGDTRKQYRASTDDSYFTGLLIRERKHFERCRSRHGDVCRQGEIKRPAADGNGFIAMWPPDQPRKGTIMVGGTQGYYEPEWTEETAWESLCGLVYWNCVEVEPGDELVITPTRRLKTPSDYFRTAADLARNQQSTP